MRLIPQLSSVTPPTRDELSELVLAEATTLLVACSDSGIQRIAGALTLVCFRVPTGRRAIIEDVIVDESARGFGLGETLVSEALRLAQEYGAKGVMLTSNPRREAANRLYQKIGFISWQTNLYFYGNYLPSLRGSFIAEAISRKTAGDCFAKRRSQ